MAQKPEVDIIIPVYNYFNKYTLPCLVTLFATVDMPFRLIVVDDGSVDNTKEEVSRLVGLNPVVGLVSHVSNRGFSEAVNTGLKISTAPYVCVLNNDTLLHSGWLRRMVEVADRDPHIGAVIPTIDQLCGLHSVFLNDGVSRVQETVYLTMCCALLRREAVDEVGLLDPSVDPILHSGQSDADYGIRLRQAGWRMCVARRSFIEHHGGGTLKSFDQYRDGSWQKENYKDLSGLRKKWGDGEVDLVISHIWKSPVGEEMI